MNEVIQFDFNDKIVRICKKGDEIFFVAKDVCDILDYSEVSSTLQKLDEDEKGTETFRTLGGVQSMSVVTESGLYTLVLRSNKPEAKPFRRWVTHEVLPSIRKKGSYSGRFAQGTLPHMDDEVIEAEVFYDKSGLEIPHPSQHRYRLPDVMSHSWMKTIVDLYGRKVAANYFAPHLGIPQLPDRPKGMMPIVLTTNNTDEMMDFLDELVIKDEHQSITVTALFQTYHQWGGGLSKNNFGKEILNCTGIESIVQNVRGTATRVYKGLTLKEEGDAS